MVKWSPRSSSYGYESFYLIMEDIGKVKNIGGYKEIRTLVDNIICPFSNAQPKHGYAVTFKTENDELKYLRLFVIDYTLTDDGAIATVTVNTNFIRNICNDSGIKKSLSFRGT